MVDFASIGTKPIWGGWTSRFGADEIPFVGSATILQDLDESLSWMGGSPERTGDAARECVRRFALSVKSMIEPESQPTSPPRKRRWLQFSLRSVLIAVTIIAILLGWKTKRVRDQVAAVDKIRALGGTVRYGHDPKSSVSLWMTPIRTASKDVPGPAWLRNWIGEDYFRYVVQVDFDLIPGKQLDNRDLAALAPHLTNLPSLETLGLSSMALDDTGLASLEQITSLQSLWLNGFPLTDKGLEYIIRLKSLETLNLRWTEITDDGLVQLRALPNLRGLSLHSRRITRKSLPILASLPKLKEAVLCDSAVNESDLQSLRREKPSLRITLSRTPGRQAPSPAPPITSPSPSNLPQIHDDQP